MQDDNNLKVSEEEKIGVYFPDIPELVEKQIKQNLPVLSYQCKFARNKAQGESRVFAVDINLFSFHASNKGFLVTVRHHIRDTAS